MVDRGALPRLTLNDAIYVCVHVRTCRFSSCACACIKSTCALRKENILGRMKNEWNKWKNHFYEMKGDVGMSVHEKERKQEDAYTKTQTHL